MASDDNGVLFVNNVLMNNGGDVNQGVANRQGFIYLAPGTYPFQDLWFQNGGGAGNGVAYLGPDTGNVWAMVQAATAYTSPGLLVGNPNATTTLNLSNPAALGTGTANFAWGALQAGSPLTIPNTVIFNSATSNAVALAGSPITFTGTVTLPGVANLSINTATTWAGGASGAGGFTLSNTPVVTGSSTYNGGGNLVVNSAAAFTGQTTVNTGTLTLNGAAGALTGTSQVNLDTSGTLTLDNTLGNNGARVNGAAPLVFNGGTLNFLGAAGAASTETFGSVLFNTGNSTVISTAGAGGTVALTATIAGRNAGATANLVAGGAQTLGSATNQFIIGVPAAALLSNGIIKGFTVTDAATGGFNFATATGAATASISALPLASYTALSATGTNTVTQNVLVDPTQAGFGAPAGAIASDTLNSLLIRGSGLTISGAAGAVLTVGGASGTAGMIAASGGTTTANTISVPTIALGTQEGVYITSNGTTAISSNITGSAGATFSGAGNLALSGANAYTNTSNTQTVTLAGATSGNFTLSLSGVLTALLPFSTTAAQLQAALQGLPNIGPGNVTVTGANPGPFTITFTGDPDRPSCRNSWCPATCSTPAATVTTAVTNTGVNNTVLNSGTLTLSSPTSLPGGLLWNGGTLQAPAASPANTPLTLSNPITLNNSVVSVAGPSPILLEGIVTLSGSNNVVQVPLPAAGTAGIVNFYGQVIGTGNLTTTGAGTLLLTDTLGGANTYSGTTIIVGGIVNVQSSSGLGARRLPRSSPPGPVCNCRPPA